jgi:hypothetical protein
MWHVPHFIPVFRTVLASVMANIQNWFTRRFIHLNDPPYKYLAQFIRSTFRNHSFMHSFVKLWLYSTLLDLGRFFSFLIFYRVGRTPWTGDQLVTRPLPAHRTAQTQNKRTHTSIPQEGFKPKIPVFKRAKTVHVFDRAATVIGHIAIIPKPKHEFLAVAILCYILLRELVKSFCSLHKYYPFHRHSYPQLCHVHSGKYHNIDYSVIIKPTTFYQ